MGTYLQLMQLRKHLGFHPEDIILDYSVPERLKLDDKERKSLDVIVRLFDSIAASDSFYKFINQEDNSLENFASKARYLARGAIIEFQFVASEARNRSRVEESVSNDRMMIALRKYVDYYLKELEEGMKVLDNIYGQEPKIEYNILERKDEEH